MLIGQELYCKRVQTVEMFKAVNVILKTNRQKFSVAFTFIYGPSK